MKKKLKKLRLNTETLYHLDTMHLGYARGGTISADNDCSAKPLLCGESGTGGCAGTDTGCVSGPV